MTNRIHRRTARDQLRRWVHLSWTDRRLLAEAGLFLPLTGALLRLLGFSRCQSLFLRLAPQPAARTVDDEALARARTAARLVKVAADRGLYHATCVPQSLVLWWMVRRQGTAAAFRIGVRKTGDRFEAHAWVECNGVAINDDADVHERFIPFGRAIVQ